MNSTVSHDRCGLAQPRRTRERVWAALLMALLWLPTAPVCAFEGVNFSLAGLDGKTYVLEAFRGQWVIVNFWATWCGTCIDEMQALQSFAAANANAQVLAVNFEEIEVERLTTFVADLKLSFPILLVADTPLVPFEPLKGLPTTAIVNPAGELVAHHTGAVTRDALERFIAAEQAAR
jgi:thiol-disulfide isomerase/thioredoxin